MNFLHIFTCEEIKNRKLTFQIGFAFNNFVLHFDRMVVVKRVNSFRDEEIEDAAHGPSIATIRHPIIRIVLYLHAFGSQPLSLAIVVAWGETPRIADVFAKTEIGDNKPITADRYHNISWANITMNVLFVVDER